MDDINANINLNSRDFLKELAQLRRGIKKDIETFSSNIDSSTDAILERRKRVLNGDYEFFAYHYFPHHIRGIPSQFQHHFCTRFPQLLRRTGGATEWWIAPRGEAKSSLSTKIAPIYCAIQALLHDEKVRNEIDFKGEIPPLIDYIIVLGAETKLPSKLLEVVKMELTTNAALMLDFPEVCGGGLIWRIGEFTTKNNIKVEAFGAEQAIRGTFHGASRPKLLMGDDLITDAEAKSPTERNNRWNWINKAIDYLGPPDGSVKYIGVGTVLHKDDPLSRAKKTLGHIVHHFRALVQLPTNMDDWSSCIELMLNRDGEAETAAAADGRSLSEHELPSYLFYLANKNRMDEGAITSWPSVRSLYYLMRQRAKNKAAFNTEMQGDGRDDSDKVFTHIRFWIHRDNRWLMLGACDPSMGKNNKSDPSSIYIGGWDREKQRLNVIDGERKRRVPSKLEADLIAYQREYNPVAVGFENNNAYEHSRQTFVANALRQGVALPLVGVTATIPPEMRIDSLEPFINDAFNPRILFSPKVQQMLDELDEWPEPQSGHHFDALTALHLLWMLGVSRGMSFGDGFQAITNPNSAAQSNDDFDDDDINDSDSWGLM